MHVFTAESDPAEVRRAIEAGEHFWLDAPRDRLAADHPAARALAGGHPAIAFAGARRDDGQVRPVEVTILAGTAGLVTLREESCGPLDRLRDSPREVDAVAVLEALTESLSQTAESVESEVEEAESRILEPRPRDALRQLAALRHQATALLRIAREQRGVVDRSQEDLGELPVRRGDAERRVRDLAGHVARASEEAESTRRTIAEALNLYLSMAAERLTRIATVLLPLTVVSGFFGMNFGWMVDHIDTLWSFVAFGIGGMVLSVAGVRLYLGRKGYT